MSWESAQTIVTSSPNYHFFWFFWNLFFVTFFSVQCVCFWINNSEALLLSRVNLFKNPFIAVQCTHKVFCSLQLCGKKYSIIASRLCTVIKRSLKGERSSLHHYTCLGWSVRMHSNSYSDAKNIWIPDQPVSRPSCVLNKLFPDQTVSWAKYFLTKLFQKKVVCRASCFPTKLFTEPAVFQTSCFPNKLFSEQAIFPRKLLFDQSISQQSCFPKKEAELTKS